MQSVPGKYGLSMIAFTTELNSTCVVAGHADHMADCPGLEAQLGLVEGVAQPGHRGAGLGLAPAPRVQYLTHDSARAETSRKSFYNSYLMSCLTAVVSLKLTELAIK